MNDGEKLNTATHLAGTVLAFGGSCYLLARATQGMRWQGVLSIAVYCGSLVLLYVCSTLYHLSSGQIKQLLRKLDHYSIYLLIAGTYTPFCTLVLDSPTGWTLLAAVWLLAGIGVAQEVRRRDRRWLSVLIYLAMGWSALSMLGPLRQTLGETGFNWVVTGGVLYTSGLIFFVLDKRCRHAHGIWHMFVLLGSASHYVAILGFVVGAP